MSSSRMTEPGLLKLAAMAAAAIRLVDDDDGEGDLDWCLRFKFFSTMYLLKLESALASESAAEKQVRLLALFSFSKNMSSIKLVSLKL